MRQIAMFRRLADSPVARLVGRRGTVKPSNTRPRNYQLELDFRRAVQQVPCRERPTLRAWLRRFRRSRGRTFVHLDPATGEWRRL